jgi:tetratricopeptide (TPR) repeat protein
MTRTPETAWGRRKRTAPSLQGPRQRNPIDRVAADGPEPILFSAMPPQDAFASLIRAGNAAFDSEDYEAALTNAIRASSVSNISSAQRGRALLDQASALRRMGKLADAMVATMDAQTVIGESSPRLVGEVLLQRANLLIDQGEYAAAVGPAREASELFSAERLGRAMTQALLTTAAAHGASGDADAAIESFERALECPLEPDLRSQAIHNLAVLLIQQERPVEAIKLLAEDAATCHQRGDRYGRGVALYNLARAQAKTRDSAAARKTLAEALLVLRSIGAAREVAAIQEFLKTLDSGADTYDDQEA